MAGENVSKVYQGNIENVGGVLKVNGQDVMAEVLHAWGGLSQYGQVVVTLTLMPQTSTVANVKPAAGQVS